MSKLIISIWPHQLCFSPLYLNLCPEICTFNCLNSILVLNQQLKMILMDNKNLFKTYLSVTIYRNAIARPKSLFLLTKRLLPDKLNYCWEIIKMN